MRQRKLLTVANNISNREKLNNSLVYTISKTNDAILRVNLKDCRRKNIIFNVEDDVNATITLSADDSDKIVKFNLSSNSNLKLNIVSLYAPFSSNSFSFRIQENASVDVAYADFTNGSGNVEVNFELLENSAKANWNLASGATQDDKKSFVVNFNHRALDTHSSMICSGVARDNANLHFLGDSHIFNGAKKSSAHQKAKIIVFDKKCVAKANPILKIDENDIEASHGAALGTVSEEQLFYLCSRGIKENDAKQMITYGYLRPIISHFADEKIIKDIEATIEKRV